MDELIAGFIPEHAPRGAQATGRSCFSLLVLRGLIQAVGSPRQPPQAVSSASSGLPRGTPPVGRTLGG